MNRKATMASVLVICGLFVAMGLPVATAAVPMYPIGEDGIWVEVAPYLFYDGGRPCIYTKIGYTHWDHSQMSITLLTPVLAGGSGYVKVLTNAGWNPPNNYDDYGYIEYTFYPDASVSYWQGKGKWVNPSAHLRYHMESTTSGVMNIDEVPFPWE